MCKVAAKAASTKCRSEVEPVAARPKNSFVRLSGDEALRKAVFGARPKEIFWITIYSANIFKNSASLSIVIVPSFLALSSFEPASSPTTK